MAKIFLNGLNSKAAGGQSILNNYLRILNKTTPKHKFLVLTPDKEQYSAFANSFIDIVDIKDLYKRNITMPFVYKYVLPKLISNLKTDLIFNLADIPVVTDTVPQVFLFDWSYAVYPDSKIWKMMDLKSLMIRKTKLYYFKKNIKHVKAIVAQTNAIKKRLEKMYGLKKIHVIPNAVSLDNTNHSAYFDFNLPQGNKLLYLTRYYPHKNIEILEKLAYEIKRKGLNYRIITTIEPSEHANAKKFLDKINGSRLNDILINVGSVRMENVPSLYKQCDALLMPTLLESFSGTYIEAMFHKLPILTSDIDFAKDICKNSAIYFDPLSVDSILSSMEKLFRENSLKNKKIEEGTKILSQLPSWNQAFEKYNQILENALVS